MEEVEEAWSFNEDPLLLLACSADEELLAEADGGDVLFVGLFKVAGCPDDKLWIWSWIMLCRFWATENKEQNYVIMLRLSFEAMFMVLIEYMTYMLDFGKPIFVIECKRSQ